VVAVTVSKVSWYGQEYCDKHSPACITASGEKFDDTKLTVACSSKYKIGDTFKITYGEKTVMAKCNDRGGFEKYGREMDLSKATFATLAPLSKGVIAVKIEKL
jgi:rare lipoprotein A